MKTRTLFLALILFSSSSAYAQEQWENRRHDISAGYGVITYDEVTGVMSSVLTTILTLANANRQNMRWTGAFSLGYKYRAGKLFPVGISVSYEKMSSDLTNKDGDLVGWENGEYITIMAEGQIRYVRKRVFQMYSGLGLGYTFASSDIRFVNDAQSNKDHFNHFNFQANLLGFRVGTVVGGFLELGFGYKGIVNFGISAQF